MDRLDAMRAFLAVAERSSFAAAARALRLSPAAATRAVAMLERSLGIPLLHRTTRSVRLTDRGAAYAEQCRRILAELDAAESLVRGQDAAPRGLLAVTAPVVFGRLHVLPMAEALATAHPELSIRLTFLDRVTHLVEEGFDLGVRIGALPDSALVAVALTEVRRVAVASPAYLEAHGVPEAPAALRRHRIVAFEGVGATNDWRFGGAGGDAPASVSVAPRLAVNTADAAIEAAIRGQGITRVLSYQVAAAIAAGALQEVLATHAPPAVPVSLVFQARSRGAPNIRAFVAEARRRFPPKS